jgi:hypothetical protein
MTIIDTYYNTLYPQGAHLPCYRDLRLGPRAHEPRVGPLVHDGHVNRFDEAWVRRLIEASGKKCTHFSKEPEGVPGESWHNWLVVLE